MKSRLSLVLALGACLCLSSGCGKNPGGAGLGDGAVKAFDNAPEAAKQMWVAALEAGKTNDYVGAEVLLFTLLREDLSPELKQVVNTQIRGVHDRLLAAVDKGDPAAKAALQELQQSPPNRRR